MSKQRAKGTSFETAVVNWLRERGRRADRIALAGSKDVGDIRCATLNFEAKNCRTYNFPGWIDESAREAVNADRPVVLVAKRNGRGDPGDAIVAMSLRDFERWFMPKPSVIDQWDPCDFDH